MKVLILAGGKGSRLNENDSKPMTTVGGIPIIRHVMNWYAKFGHKDFIVLGGQHINKLKDYFNNIDLYSSNIEFDYTTGKRKFFESQTIGWKVTIIDTGLESNTAARIFKAKDLIGNDNMFLLAYSDCLTNADINDEINEHVNSGKIVTNMGFVPDGRFGFMDIASDGTIEHLYEKQNVGRRFANGGYFVCNRKLFDYMSNDETIAFEMGPITDLVKCGQVHCYRHNGWFSVMDTPQDHAFLERIWKEGNAPWKV